MARFGITWFDVGAWAAITGLLTGLLVGLARFGPPTEDD